MIKTDDLSRQWPTEHRMLAVERVAAKMLQYPERYASKEAVKNLGKMIHRFASGSDDFINLRMKDVQKKL